MFAYHYNNEHIKKLKGMKKSFIKNDIKFDDYKITLFNYLQLEHTMNQIGSNNHNLKTFKIDKVSLSSFDDKRYILDDKITTLAYGHKNIPF